MKGVAFIMSINAPMLIVILMYNRTKTHDIKVPICRLLCLFDLTGIKLDAGRKRSEQLYRALREKMVNTPGLHGLNYPRRVSWRGCWGFLAIR